MCHLPSGIYENHKSQHATVETSLAMTITHFFCQVCISLTGETRTGENMHVLEEPVRRPSGQSDETHTDTRLLLTFHFTCLVKVLVIVFEMYLTPAA